MLNPEFSPSRLVAFEDRPPVPIVSGQVREPGTWWFIARIVSWAAAIGWLRLTRRLTPQAAALRLTGVLEEFGGIWLKAGQLLALRVDLFSAELCRELTRLQTRGGAVPFATARTILEGDLGPLDAIFDEFDERPFAATWIGQLHRARLRREQVWVAVKIQRPGVARAFARDLRRIRATVRVLDWFNVYGSVLWKRGLQELEQIAREESDFRFEAASIGRMQEALPRRKIVVPEVFLDYCRPRVLVTEFIHAALMSDFIRLDTADPPRLAAWLAENGIEPRRLARRLVHSFLRQLFEENFYHGDLYPGNIVLLRGSRVALLHFGACGVTEREYLLKLRLFFRALATRDFAKAADLALLLSGRLPAIDVEEVKEELVRELRAWASRTFVKGLPYHEKSIDNATVVVTQTLFKYGCPMDWAFLRVRRALTILDASLVHLDPDINYTSLCSSYFRKADRRARARALGRSLAARAADSTLKGLDMKDRLAEYALFQGGIVRRHAQVFQGATGKLSELVAALLGQVGFVMLLLGVFLALALIDQQWPGAVASVVGPQLGRLVERVPTLDRGLWIAVLAAITYAWWTVRRLKRRFREKTVRRPEREA